MANPQKNVVPFKTFFNGAAAAYVNELRCETSMRKAVLIQLAGFCDPDTLNCSPTQRGLAERLQIGTRQLLTHLAGLEEEGKIERIPRYGGDGGRLSDRYVIVGLAEYMAEARS